MPAAQGPSTGSRRRKEQRYRSVISDIFDGSILSLVQCLTCDRVSALRWGWGEERVLRLRPPPFSRGRALGAGCPGPGVGEQALCLPPASRRLGLGADPAWSERGGILEGGDPGLPLTPQVSTTVETFQDLSLPIPGKEDLAKLHSAIYQNVPAKPGSCGDSYAAQGWLAFIMEYIRR